MQLTFEEDIPSVLFAIMIMILYKLMADLKKAGGLEPKLFRSSRYCLEIIEIGTERSFKFRGDNKIGRKT